MLRPDMPLSLLSKRILLLVVAFFAMLLPAAAFAQSSGSGGLQTSQILTATGNKLPFLREASTGSFVTTNAPLTNDSTAISGGLTSQSHKCRFQDISGDKAEHAINYLYDKNVAGGRKPCMFQPNYAATRAEAAAMAVRAIQASIPSEVGVKPFPDVDTNAWHARYISSAKTNGIVHGYPDKLYRPDQPVNKVEVLKIVTRAFKSDFSKINFDQLKQYSDLELNQWYVQYVDAGFDQGLVGKNGALEVAPNSFQPAEYITRSDLAQMIYAMMIK